MELCENLFFIKCFELSSTYNKIIQYTNLHRDYFRDEATIRDVIGGQVDVAAAAAGGVVVDVTDISKHYIIIDAAHLYKYIGVNTVYNSDMYKRPQDGSHKLNSIYLSLFGTEILPGFVSLLETDVVNLDSLTPEDRERWFVLNSIEGPSKDEWSRTFKCEYINYAEFFKVLEDGSIRTYIDMMYNSGYKMTENTMLAPPYKIQLLYESLAPILRNHGYNSDIIMSNKEIVKEIIIYMVDLIMEGVSEPDLIVNLVEYIIFRYFT